MTTCGEAGGKTKAGRPCRQRVSAEGARCPRHPTEGEPANVGGRPRIELTDADIERIERLSAVVQEDELCYVLDIPDRTFRDIKSRDPRVSAAYKRGRANLKARAGQTLLGLALGRMVNHVGPDGVAVVVEQQAPDKAALFFFLKTQCGYRETDRHEHVGGGPSAAPLDVRLNTDDLDNDELDTLEQLLARATIGVN